MAPGRSRGSWPLRVVALRSAIALLGLVWAGVLVGQQQPDPSANGDSSTAEIAGTRLTVPVQETLLRVQDQWLVWNSAFLQGDRTLAWAAVRDLAGTSREIGLRRLPELALGMAARAVEAAREDKLERAQWALEMAEELDPGLPAIAFAGSRVAWLSGDPLVALSRGLEGMGRIVQRARVRRLWTSDLLVWLVVSLMIAASLFVALQMATKGSGLYRDLIANLGGSLPTSVAVLVAIVVLIWPFFLPSGWVWLILFWAILLWSYASTSERWVLGLVVAVMVVGPAVMELQQRRLAITLQPEIRLLDNVGDSVLYGRLFEDLASLRATASDHPATLQLVADLHVGLGQDDIARPLYQAVIEREPNNGAALNNLGVYHFLRQEYVDAIKYLAPATRFERSSLAAHYNLASAYLKLMEYRNFRSEFDRARGIDRLQVAEWMDEERESVTLLGGVERIGELRGVVQERLAATSEHPFEPAHWAIFAAAVLGGAWFLRRMGQGAGLVSAAPSRLASSRPWHQTLRIMVPGLVSASAGDGGRAFAALLLPVAVLLLPFRERLGYAVPWGFEPGNGAAWTISLALLAGFFIARWMVR